MEKLEKFQLMVSATVITLGILISSLVFASRIPKNESITVTGSASKVVKSDSAKLGFELQAREKSQRESFAKLRATYPEVEKYLISKGIDKKDIDKRAMNGYYNYKNINGYSTNEIVSYNANLEINIQSKDVNKIKEISTDIQSLSDKGIEIQTYQPEFYYSDLASIKIDLLKEASKDAKQRAESMLNATGSSVGKVKQIRMGVFQITSPDSTDVSDMGINDTSSIDKKVTAVANVVFKVR